LVHAAWKQKVPVRLEGADEERGSGRGKLGQSGGGPSPPGVAEAVDAADVVQKVVAGFEAKSIQLCDVASDPLHLNAFFGRSLPGACQRLVDVVDRGDLPTAL